tara:strand:+ start:135 stop:548 length:414 start_codon:yes stop_codon:yes gene_type:complete
MSPIKVSFDFDATLSINSVQDYARELIKQKVEVWVTTSRSKSSISGYTMRGMRLENMNDDLFKVTDNLGIQRDRITFTEYCDKSEFLNNQGFIWHLDDDDYELEMIKKDTDLEGVMVFGNPHWENECNNILKSWVKK